MTLLSFRSVLAICLYNNVLFTIYFISVHRNNVTELTYFLRRNVHGVPKENIKRMLERYEDLTTEKVLREVNRHLENK